MSETLSGAGAEWRAEVAFARMTAPDALRARTSSGACGSRNRAGRGLAGGFAVNSHQEAPVSRVMPVAGKGAKCVISRGEGRTSAHRALALMAEKRFDAGVVHTHTFRMKEAQTARRFARELIEDATSVVVSMRQGRDAVKNSRKQDRNRT